MPMISDSPSTYGNDTLARCGRRASGSPLRTASGSAFSSRASSRSRSALSFGTSVAISSRQMRAASPMPTMPVTLSVPERMPRSWPPPSIWAVRRTRGFLRRTYRQPTPLGPYILCAEIDIRSTCCASTSSGILPGHCVASVWNSVPFCLHSAPISAIGCSVPTSLLAAISDTRIVRSVIAAASWAMSTWPLPSTGSHVTSKPCASRFFIGSSTALCSVTAVIRWLPFSRYIWATPLIARLLASVEPLVQRISLGCAPISCATWLRASSTAASAVQPNAWLRLAALPKASVKNGSMRCTTRGSHGVVAL